ncbi:uncharacterized protein EI97DRAFT_407019 [Westerdykella ornata]|uniref:Large ribosomal subunit protein uL23m n=1 Tax=Westerdykella ornata TaxID=318751 RepID=A0A6A6J698_WESOR|nr:uncharacterized protein EI97DRAFT_407019 [Westerdykella ornata]KAF2272101.1 hypothetical protein EI97DRAFT_407019 [Westerdykella ornata]
MASNIMNAVKILKFGKKEIYLPRFTIALVRSHKLPPNFAKFKVPLNFSKFDLRDYLFHAYNVRALSIRSAVRQMPVRRTPVSDDNDTFWRPEAEKYMTVEMERPFVWPEEPKEVKPWGEVNKNTKENRLFDEMDEETLIEERDAWREQARKIVAGKAAGLKAWEERRTEKYITVDEPGYKIRI